MGTVGRPTHWGSWVAEWLLAIVVAVVASALAVGPVMVLGRLPVRSVEDSGRRYEPPPVPGARVQTPYGSGTIVRDVAFGDGPRWQVRLDSGRHVLLYRAEMVVTGWPQEAGGATP